MRRQSFVKEFYMILHNCINRHNFIPKWEPNSHFTAQPDLQKRKLNMILPTLERALSFGAIKSPKHIEKDLCTHYKNGIARNSASFALAQ